jgi:hypothetical protein
MLPATLAHVKTTVIVCLYALVLPAVASAHGGGSQHEYISTVDRIVNAHGVDAQASGDGHFSFSAPAGHTVIVRGYSGEPYLRFQGGKIEANELAPTTFVNRDEPPPASADAKARPQWRQIGSGLKWTWHDHRTHWMASQAPAAITKAPKASHHVFGWKVTGTVDTRPFEIVGSLDWAPAKSRPGYVWISYLAIAFGVLYAAFLILSKRRASTGSKSRV